MTYTLGLDYASWQGRPHFPTLKGEGIAFAITKVTGENNYVNPYWGENTVAARAASVVTGFYDWVEPHLMATPDDGAAAARDYLRVIAPLVRPGDLICVDYESPLWKTGPRGTDIAPVMRPYFETIRDEGPSRTVIVYTGGYFLQETGADKWDWLTEENGFFLWNAAPGAGMMADDSFWPATPKPFTRTVFHQHQWYATSDAIVGQFDKDRFLGAVEDLALYGVPDTELSKAPVALEELGDVKEPADGKYTAYINDNGEAIVVLNFGGKTGRIAGVNIVDVGVTVASATEDNVLEDRSFKNLEAQPWTERRAS